MRGWIAGWVAAAVLSMGCTAAVAAHEAANSAEPLPLFEATTRPDLIGRVLVPVLINNRGPYAFVLDTGANRTVLTPRLVAALGLQSSLEDRVTLSGVTGSASVATVLVDRVKVGDVELKHERLPVADSLSIDTQGVLGVDA